MATLDNDSRRIVVKVGGSLFHLPDLGERLSRWLKNWSDYEVLLVPGGGLAADVIREYDHCHHLGEEASHWLALRAMTLNAHFLAALLRDKRTAITGDVAAVPGFWRQGRLPILDAHAFAVADENSPGALPHTWEVTSDSVAGRAAVLLGAEQLILLKSVSAVMPFDVSESARAGLVDSYLTVVLQSALPSSPLKEGTGPFVASMEAEANGGDQRVRPVFQRAVRLRVSVINFLERPE